MWRCPGCVTHCEDEQDVCPTCQLVRSEQPVDKEEEDWSDSDPAFPPGESEWEPTEPHPLLPDLPRRTVKVSEWSPSLLKGLLIAFLAGFLLTWLIRTAGVWQFRASAKETLEGVIASFFGNLCPGGVMGVFAALGWAFARLFFPGENLPDEEDV